MIPNITWTKLKIKQHRIRKKCHKEIKIADFFFHNILLWLYLFNNMYIFLFHFNSYAFNSTKYSSLKTIIQLGFLIFIMFGQDKNPKNDKWRIIKILK